MVKSLQKSNNWQQNSVKVNDFLKEALPLLDKEEEEEEEVYSQDNPGSIRSLLPIRYNIFLLVKHLLGNRL